MSLRIVSSGTGEPAAMPVLFISGVQHRARDVFRGSSPEGRKVK